MNFGSKSTWMFAIAEGDRNLADLACQRKGMDGGVGWVELMNLKVIAVWASSLPSLPQSTRSALLSRFLPAVGNRGESAESSPNRTRGQSPHCPDANY